MEQQALELPVANRQDFSSFIPCSGNQSALQFCQRILDQTSIEQVLYLYGASGSGKTHLLQALADAAGVPRHQASALPETIFEQDYPILVIDALEELPDAPDQRGLVWELFNRYYTEGKKIVLAGQLAPQELPTIDDHLKSRLLWGLVAHLDISDDPSRRMLISKLARDRNVIVPDAVADWLLTVLPRHAGALIAALDRLYRCALKDNRRITLPFARTVFLDTDDSRLID